MADTYIPITFVADEILTSTKMNMVAANQSAFHSGEGLGDGIIGPRHLDYTAIAKVPADVTSSRALNVDYVNENDYSIEVYATVYLTADSQWRQADGMIDGDRISTAYTNGSGGIIMPIHLTVPPGSTYRIKTGSGTANKVTLFLWTETD